ncbi:MAG: hypothetical protein HY587_03980 [Candidatus Omnitrophica bacterium]|nr:hypothetical protein [Candidatus Omnitrophota bacterium]
MKLLLLALTLSFTVITGNGQVLAVEDSHAGHEHHMHEEASAAPAGSVEIHPVKREDGIIDLNNKVCLVSGKDVSGKDFQVHNGVNYGFCCKMCVRDFMKAPEKFALDQETIDAALAKPAA